MKIKQQKRNDKDFYLSACCDFKGASTTPIIVYKKVDWIPCPSKKGVGGDESLKFD